MMFHGGVDDDAMACKQDDGGSDGDVAGDGDDDADDGG